MWVTTLTAWVWFCYNPIFSVFYLLFPLWSILADADHNNRITQKLKFKIFRTTHRTRTHTVWFWFFMVAIFALLAYFIKDLSFTIFDYKTLFVLIMSHMLWDLFTKRGVRLFYPLKLSFRLPFVSTWTKSEKIFQLVLLWLLTLGWVFFINNWFLIQFIDWFKEYLLSYNITTLYFILLINMLILLFLFFKEISKYDNYFKKIFSMLIQFILFSVVPLLTSIFLFLEKWIKIVSKNNIKLIFEWGYNMIEMQFFDFAIIGLWIIGLYFLYKFWKVLLWVLTDQLLYFYSMSIIFGLFWYAWYVLFLLQ